METNRNKEVDNEFQQIFDIIDKSYDLSIIATYKDAGQFGMSGDRDKLIVLLGALLCHIQNHIRLGSKEFEEIIINSFRQYRALLDKKRNGE